MFAQQHNFIQTTAHSDIQAFIFLCVCGFLLIIRNLKLSECYPHSNIFPERDEQSNKSRRLVTCHLSNECQAMPGNAFKCPHHLVCPVFCFQKLKYNSECLSRCDPVTKDTRCKHSPLCGIAARGYRSSLPTAVRSLQTSGVLNVLVNEIFKGDYLK